MGVRGRARGSEVIPNIDLSTGHIPPGRYRTTLDETRAFFVDATSFGGTQRAAIWEEWLEVTAALRAVVPVISVWLSGSFISAKQGPSDLDCTYWIDVADLAAVQADPQKNTQLGAFFQNGWLKTQGLRVDPYLGTWRPIIDPVTRMSEDDAYYWGRGHWDDFWQRARSAPGTPASRLDTFPRRGYLEVELDGHTN